MQLKNWIDMEIANTIQSKVMLKQLAGVGVIWNPQWFLQIKNPKGICANPSMQQCLFYSAGHLNGAKEGFL